MNKISKKSKGAAVLEPNEEAPIENVSDPIAYENPENSFDHPCPEEEIFLEPEERDIPIYIFAPKHSKSFRKLATKQFSEGKVKNKGSVLLPDGQIIRAGATIKTLMKPGLRRMLIDGVFLAGKAPRKEGKGARKVV
jgi:hypothetical protein